MIDKDILHRLRNGVCAVGYLMQPLADFNKTYRIAGNFEVVGTGFLVRDDLVITNRHVIDDLESGARGDGIPDTQFFLLFALPHPGGFLTTSNVPGQVTLHGPTIMVTARQMRYTHRMQEPRLDVAFIQFKVVNQQGFAKAEPVEIDDPLSISVSEEIAAFGFPHGRSLLEKDGTVHRWGPILQRGWISAIAPFEGIGPPNEFLLDLRAAPGISGSPVFRPSSGRVVGMLHAGIFGSDRRDAITTTAFAQPISQTLLADWLVEFDLNREVNET